jgi:hypothetical protein
MANFGTHLAYPTPDWVAYRVQDQNTPARPARDSKHGRLLAGIVKALRRFASAWVRANSYNAYL